MSVNESLDWSLSVLMSVPAFLSELSVRDSILIIIFVFGFIRLVSLALSLPTTIHFFESSGFKKC